MAHPLLVLWRRVLSRHESGPGPVRATAAPLLPDVQASASIFLILRRMRAPLIILVLIFAVSVLGLSLIPGVDAAGQRWRMSIFDAFYFMSFTATTIGFGELPRAFSDAQRIWVIVSIYLTVIGWAYAIGSLLSLLQDRAFRQALALQHFQRKVNRLREPFLLLAGYGQTGEVLGRSFDALGRRFVVIDNQDDRIDALDLASYHSDVPGLIGDAGNPYHLQARRHRLGVLRGGAGADRRRRGQPRGHDGLRAAAPRPAGGRAHRLDGDRAPHAGLRDTDRGQPVRPVR